jgi:hypothetical protein
MKRQRRPPRLRARRWLIGARRSSECGGGVRGGRGSASERFGGEFGSGWGGETGRKSTTCRENKSVSDERSARTRRLKECCYERRERGRKRTFAESGSENETGAIERVEEAEEFSTELRKEGAR